MTEYGLQAAAVALVMIAAVLFTNATIQTIVEQVVQPGLADTTAVIFTADHGGAGNFHAANDPRSRTIPWIITGPGIRQDHDLTQDYYTHVNTTDTFATACHLLAIPIQHKIQGKLIRQIFESPPAADNLLFDTGPSTAPSSQPAAR